ncbi:MAG: hypothetical protein ACI4SB_07945, partial [Acutalibacteraceae bacterium]
FFAYFLTHQKVSARAARAQGKKIEESGTVKNRLTDKGKFKAAVCGEAAHLPLPQATANTKPQVLSAAVRPSDEACHKAARLTVTYNLQTSRYGKPDSADCVFPPVQRKSATTSNI